MSSPPYSNNPAASYDSEYEALAQAHATHAAAHAAANAALYTHVAGTAAAVNSSGDSAHSMFSSEPLLLRSVQAEHRPAEASHNDAYFGPTQLTLSHMHDKYSSENAYQAAAQAVERALAAASSTASASSASSSSSSIVAPLCPAAMFEPSTSFLTMLAPHDALATIERTLLQAPFHARVQATPSACTVHASIYASSSSSSSFTLHSPISLVLSVFSTERADGAHVVEVQRRQGDLASFRSLYAALISALAPHIVAMLDGRSVGAHAQQARSFDPPPIDGFDIDEDALDQQIMGMMMQRTEHSCLSEARHSMNWMASHYSFGGVSSAVPLPMSSPSSSSSSSMPSSMPSMPSSPSSSSSSSSSSLEMEAARLLELVHDKFTQSHDLEQRRAALALLLQAVEASGQSTASSSSSSSSLVTTQCFAASVSSLVRVLFEYLQQPVRDAARPSVLSSTFAQQEIRRCCIAVLRWVASTSRFSHELRHATYLAFLQSPGAHLPIVDVHEERDLRAVYAALQ